MHIQRANSFLPLKWPELGTFSSENSCVKSVSVCRQEVTSEFEFHYHHVASGKTPCPCSSFLLNLFDCLGLVPLPWLTSDVLITSGAETWHRWH